MRKKLLISVILCFFVLTACAQIQSFLGSETPTKIGLRFVKTFNSEFDRTIKMVLKPTLTPAEKDLILLQIKDSSLTDTQKQDIITKNTNPNLTVKEKQIINTRKAILVQAKPLIDIYVKMVQGGGTPSSLDEKAIENLLTKLLQTI